MVCKIKANAFKKMKPVERGNALRMYLLDYLHMQGIEAEYNTFISCIDPDHEDVHPSMYVYEKSVKTGTPVLHCYSHEGHHFDLFGAIGVLEDKLTFREQYLRAVELFVQKKGSL